MLPDYPKGKEQIEKLMYTAFASGRNPLLMGIQQVPMHEGNRGRVIRADGSSDEYGFRTHSAKISIKTDEMGSMTIGDAMARAAAAGNDAGLSMSAHMLEKLDEITTETGNRFDMEGNLTPEKLLTVLRGYELDFDDAGNPEWPTFVGGDSGARAVQSVLETIEKTPTLKDKMKTLVIEKQEQWRDRESRRKLVG